MGIIESVNKRDAELDSARKLEKKPERQRKRDKVRERGAGVEI